MIHCLVRAQIWLAIALSAIANGLAADVRVFDPHGVEVVTLEVLDWNGDLPEFVRLSWADGSVSTENIDGPQFLTTTVTDEHVSDGGWHVQQLEEPAAIVGRQEFVFADREGGHGHEFRLERLDGTPLLVGESDVSLNLITRGPTIIVRWLCGKLADKARDDCHNHCNATCGDAGLDSCRFDSGGCGVINSSCQVMCLPTTGDNDCSCAGEPLCDCFTG